MGSQTRGGRAVKAEHAVFVWSAYAVFGAMLAWDFVIPRLRERRALRGVRRRVQRDAARRAA